MRVMVWLQVTLLLQASVAFQVLTMLMAPGTILVISPWIVMVTLVPPHVAVAVGASKFHAVPHSTVRLEAQVKVGGDATTTVKRALELTLPPRLLVMATL